MVHDPRFGFRSQTRYQVTDQIPGSRDHVSQGHRPWTQVTSQGVIQITDHRSQAISPGHRPLPRSQTRVLSRSQVTGYNIQDPRCQPRSQITGHRSQTMVLVRLQTTIHGLNHRPDHRP